MSLKYREDPDLAFLGYADHEGLAVLARFLTHDTDGRERYAQELLAIEEFKASQGDLTTVWRLIAAEFQAFGGDAIANRLRGTGVLYREVLGDVCSRVGVPGDPPDSVLAQEDRLIAELLKRFFEKATPDEVNAVLEAATEGAGRLKRLSQAELLGLVGTDFKTSLLVVQVIAQAVAKALLVGGAGAALGTALSAAAARAVLAAVPIVNAILIPLTISMATGPAFRVTIPAVVHIAYLRRLALAPRYKARRQ